MTSDITAGSWLNDTVTRYCNEPSFIFLCSFAIIFSAFALYKCRARKGAKSIFKILDDNLKVCTAVILALGFILYFCAYWKGSHGNLIVLLPKAIVSSLKMFVSASGLIDLKSELKDSVIFMSAFSIVNTIALVISVMFVMKVLGYKVESYLKMKFGTPGKKTYIFWGINENSLLLAESIENRSESSIIFVDLPNAEKKNGNLIQDIIGNNNLSRDQIYRLENIGAFLISSGCGLNELPMKSERKEKDFYSLLDIKVLRKYTLSAKDVNHYFLSDTEQENLDNLMSIINHFGADQIDNLPFSRIYCHARYNSLNNIIDRLSEKICFVDSSRLSVLQLEKNVRYQPAAFVSIDTERAVVKSSFNALLIGFGETGRDAFKFIYEFSSFIGDNGLPSRRSINVVDMKLDERKARFLVSSPALENCSDINWWDDMNIDSIAFWDKYKSMIDSLNYILIALNDDKTASDIAVKLYETAYRYRKDMRNFKVFVRQRDEESADKLQHASDYYMLKSNREDKGENTIVTFGTGKSLFNVSIFDTEVVDAEAKKFSDQYYELYKAISERLGSSGSPSPANMAKDVKRAADKQQDISNVRHVYTKLIMAGAYDSQWRLRHDRMQYLRKISERNGEKYPNALPSAEEAYTLMENLSLTEHLRWNAKMELMGFVKRAYNPETTYPERDYDKKNHECIVSCDELNSREKFRETKIYDWAVVELSFRYGDSEKAN